MNITTTQPKISMTETAGLESRVGNTPLLPLHRVTLGLPPSVRVFAKAEWFNPGGSIKDRAALNIIYTAIANGDLTPGKHLLDSTSGNTGIAYATFGALMGFPVTLTMPADASPERVGILHALGVNLLLIEGGEDKENPTQVARRMAEAEPEKYFYANQYDNSANWLAHYRSTGPEIFAQTGGAITHFVAGMGTSGTLMGTGRYLREENPTIKIIAGQPVVASHGLEGLKHMKTTEHPGIYDENFPDRFIEVESDAARAMVRQLARQEGLFVGLSSGAAAVAALRVAEELESGIVVTIFPDAGYKYLSDEKLWA